MWPLGTKTWKMEESLLPIFAAPFKRISHAQSSVTVELYTVLSVAYTWPKVNQSEFGYNLGIYFI